MNRHPHIYWISANFCTLINVRYLISVLSIVPQQYEAEITNISVWPQEKFKMKFKRVG